MNTFNPETNELHTHYGDVPSGGRLTCGMNRYASTPVTTNPEEADCPDCSEELVRWGKARIDETLNDTGAMSLFELPEWLPPVRLESLSPMSYAIFDSARRDIGTLALVGGVWRGWLNESFTDSVHKFLIPPPLVPVADWEVYASSYTNSVIEGINLDAGK